MNLIFLGAPGAGKGTAATRLAEMLRLPHISTGEIFRTNIGAGTELGKLADHYISKGCLVPDEVTIGMVDARLNERDCQHGFILDGFPRTLPQAEALDEILGSNSRSLDRAIDIVISEQKLLERLTNRRVCSGCKLSYNLRTHHITGETCPACGSRLVIRDDDKPEVIKARMETYHRDTEPLIDYYAKARKLVRANSEDRIEDTFANILAALGISGR